MSNKSLSMVATGELILGMSEPSPEFYFELVAPTLRSADIVVGQLEVPHTNRPEPPGEVMMPAPPPENMRGLPVAGFTAVSMAGNPTYTYGTPGIVDTIDWLQNHGIGYFGAGMNIGEARRPLLIERGGVRFGFLSFNCVSTDRSAATSTKPGCAYVDIITHYERGKFPGGQPIIFTFAERWSLEAMKEDIRSLRQNCDILTVFIHKGGARTEIVLADYEFEVPYAAINAGADLILGYHTHALRGVEFYQGKPIFHCLGNLVTVYPWESHHLFKKTERENTLAKSLLRGGAGGGRSMMDPEYPCYPFPAWSRKGIISKFIVENRKISGISYLPCLINKNGQPEILRRDVKGQEVFDYMEKITRAARLNARYEWDGDEVIIHS